MTDSEFDALATDTLNAVEAAVEAAAEAGDVDIEVTRSGNVLTLELDDGARLVVNSQAPMRQIWVAARAGGFHYDRRGDEWRDTRDGSELFAALSRLLSTQAGVPLTLVPPA